MAAAQDHPSNKNPTNDNLRTNGHANGNPKHEQKDKDEESQQKPPRSRFASAIQTFSPIWFAIVMNTGILGIIMHENPQPYNGFWWQICSYILFVFSLILFGIFALIYLLRAILYPHTIPGPSKDRPGLSVETTAISTCIPISALTLLDQTILIATNANWNGSGYGFTLFCYASWWIVVLWILATTQTTLINLARSSTLTPDSLPPALIIPGVGVVTAALTGAIIVTYGHDISPELAVPVIIVGYILLGWGFFWALFLYSIFLVRIMDVGWPAPEVIPTLAFLVGPPGQTAGALVALGTAAQKYFPAYGTESPIFTTAGGDSFAAISTLLALIFLGLYALWLIFAIYGILEAVFTGKIKAFAFTWWGTIFPTATGNLAFLLLADGFNSQAFALLSTIWLTVLFVDYFACWVFTVKGIWRGSILDGRNDDERQAREKKD